MITSVSRWRCKCGVHVKVVAETAKNTQGSTQQVACPQCGDKQIVYGMTVVSITTESDANRPLEK